MKISQIPPHMRPRERAWKEGVERLSEEELMAILLRSGRKGKNAIDMARHLLHAYDGNLLELSRVDTTTLTRKGLGKVQAITLLSALELGNRLTHVHKEAQSLKEALIQVQGQIQHSPRESFFLICLNLRNTCVGPPIHMGGGTKYHVHVDPREILNKAIQREAGRIVLVHNHPSHDPTPSPQDILLTKQIMEGCAWVDIELYDHVIVTRKEMLSMRALGMLR